MNIRSYSVDWIEQHLVTEAMIDRAVEACPPPRSRSKRDEAAANEMIAEARRAKAKRNVAIGLHAGSYAWRP